MTELAENNQAKIQLEMDEGEIRSLLEGIGRCTERLESLIRLKASMVIVKNEIDMIQYRALGVLGIYECWALINFVCKKDKKRNKKRKKKRKKKPK